MITETMVNGQPYSEKIVSSGSVVDGLVFEFVIFDYKGAGGMDTVATSRLLARNARVLKAANAAVMQVASRASQKARVADLSDARCGTMIALVRGDVAVRVAQPHIRFRQADQRKDRRPC